MISLHEYHWYFIVKYDCIPPKLIAVFIKICPAWCSICDIKFHSWLELFICLMRHNFVLLLWNLWSFIVSSRGTQKLKLKIVIWILFKMVFCDAGKWWVLKWITLCTRVCVCHFTETKSFVCMFVFATDIWIPDVRWKQTLVTF